MIDNTLINRRLVLEKRRWGLLSQHTDQGCRLRGLTEARPKVNSASFRPFGKKNLTSLILSAAAVPIGAKSLPVRIMLRTWPTPICASLPYPH